MIDRVAGSPRKPVTPFLSFIETAIGSISITTINNVTNNNLGGTSGFLRGSMVWAAPDLDGAWSAQIQVLTHSYQTWVSPRDPASLAPVAALNRTIGRHWGHQDGRSEVLEGVHEVGEPGQGLQGNGGVEEQVGQVLLLVVGQLRAACCRASGWT